MARSEARMGEAGGKNEGLIPRSRRGTEDGEMGRAWSRSWRGRGGIQSLRPEINTVRGKSHLTYRIAGRAPLTSVKPVSAASVLLSSCRHRTLNCTYIDTCVFEQDLKHHQYLPSFTAPCMQRTSDSSQASSSRPMVSSGAVFAAPHDVSHRPGASQTRERRSGTLGARAKQRDFGSAF